MMQLAITFGDQYRRDPHPREPKAHPDGYWVFEAEDRETAREGAFARLGDAWAFDYDLQSEKFQADIAEWYPRGELGRTRVTRNPPVSVEDITPEIHVGDLVRTPECYLHPGQHRVLAIDKGLATIDNRGVGEKWPLVELTRTTGEEATL